MRERNEKMKTALQLEIWRQFLTRTLKSIPRALPDDVVRYWAAVVAGMEARSILMTTRWKSSEGGTNDMTLCIRDDKFHVSLQSYKAKLFNDVIDIRRHVHSLLVTGDVVLSQRYYVCPVLDVIGNVFFFISVNLTFLLSGLVFTSTKYTLWIVASNVRHMYS